MDIKNTKQLQAGDNVFFGAYPYDKDGTVHPIKWRVLDVRDGKALLLSEYGLDAQPYHNVFECVTWENCSLRAWLNQTFFRTAFTKEEQAVIQLSHIDNSKSQGNPNWNTDGGSDTQDKIFLLSYKEIFEDYFALSREEIFADYFDGFDDTVSRTCKATFYAKNRGTYVDKHGFCCFWLRSPGDCQDFAIDVGRSSWNRSSSVNFDSGCVRPALWVNLKSLQYLVPNADRMLV